MSEKPKEPAVFFYPPSISGATDEYARPSRRLENHHRNLRIEANERVEAELAGEAAFREAQAEAERAEIEADTLRAVDELRGMERLAWEAKRDEFLATLARNFADDHSLDVPRCEGHGEGESFCEGCRLDLADRHRRAIRAAKLAMGIKP